jgi:hypothetical protein
MAKVIRYKFLSAEINHGTDDNPVIEQIFLDKTMTWSEVNEEIAMKEAFNGEYTIEDDGQEEPEHNPTIEDRVGILETETSDLSEALEMILSGVTE